MNSMRVKKLVFGGAVALTIFGIIVVFDAVKHSNKPVNYRTGAYIMNDRVNIPVTDGSTSSTTPAQPINNSTSNSSDTSNPPLANQSEPTNPLTDPTPEPQPKPETPKPAETPNIERYPGEGVTVWTNAP